LILGHADGAPAQQGRQGDTRNRSGDERRRRGRMRMAVVMMMMMM
jgi:hypothetical protein